MGQPRVPVIMTSAPEDEFDHEIDALEHLELDLYRVQCSNAFGKDFIPAKALERLINTDAISRILHESHSRLRLTGSITEVAERVCANGDVSYRKIFAILVLGGMLERLPDFLLSSFYDSRLPVPDIIAQDALLPPTALLKDWQTLTRKWRRREVDHFTTYQWRVLVPVFTRQEFQHSLCMNHVLPFEESHERSEGGFGTVYKVKIHPDHHDFGTLEVSFQAHRRYGLQPLTFSDRWIPKPPCMR
jgi:hypothetical protein